MSRGELLSGTNTKFCEIQPSNKSHTLDCKLIIGNKNKMDATVNMPCWYK